MLAFKKAHVPVFNGYYLYAIQLLHSICSVKSLHWRHNGRDSVSNHQPHDCLLNRLFRRRSKKTSKLRVTGLCVGNLPGTGEFPAQMASNAENVSIWWRHHVLYRLLFPCFQWRLYILGQNSGGYILSKYWSYGQTLGILVSEFITFFNQTAKCSCV